MFIISGNARSGTSLMTLCLLKAFGEDRVLGEKWPQLKQKERIFTKYPQESEDEYNYRIFSWETTQREKWEEDFKQSQIMNPKGFYESPYVMGGIFFMPPFEEQQNKILQETDENRSICKIVSQGLTKSDPRFITKVLFMLRHPRAVAKSQENLKHILEYSFIDENGNKGKPFNLIDDLGITIHSPEYFIEVTLMAIDWLLKHPNIPVKLVEYEELVENPKKVLTEVKEFLNAGGDFDKAIEYVEPKLRRSYPQDVEHNLWEDAELIYEKFRTNDREQWKEILETFKDKKRQTNRTNRSWNCLRTGTMVPEHICKSCKKDKEFRKNFSQLAIQNGTDWKNMPCAFEVAYDLDNPHVSIEESIRNNFWV